MTNLPFHGHKFNHAIAVCLHGDKMSLTHLWGSVMVELNFDETDVHTTRPIGKLFFSHKQQLET